MFVPSWRQTKLLVQWGYGVRKGPQYPLLVSSKNILICVVLQKRPQNSRPRHGANPYVKDTLGDTPLDTSRKHLNLSSENALLKYTNTEKLYDRYQNKEFSNSMSSCHYFIMLHRKKKQMHYVAWY